MSNRQKPIHPTAAPLADCLKAHTFTRGEIAAHFGMDVQNVTNWCARGVPSKRMTEVAEFCGMTTDEYRFKAGLTKVKPPTHKHAVVDLSDGLPECLQNYLRHKIVVMRNQYQTTPEWLRKKLDPPADEAEYQEWEASVEQLLASFAKFKEAPATTARDKKKSTT